MKTIRIGMHFQFCEQLMFISCDFFRNTFFSDEVWLMVTTVDSGPVKILTRPKKHSLRNDKLNVGLESERRRFLKPYFLQKTYLQRAIQIFSDLTNFCKLKTWLKPTDFFIIKKLYNV